jgi:hypothetical protein
MKQNRCDYSSRKIREITQCNLQYTRIENCAGIVKRFKLNGFVELQHLSLCEWDLIKSKDIYFLTFKITQEKQIQDTFRARHFKRLSLLSFEFHWYRTRNFQQKLTLPLSTTVQLWFTFFSSSPTVSACLWFTYFNLHVILTPVKTQLMLLTLEWFVATHGRIGSVIAGSSGLTDLVQRYLQQHRE